MFDGLRNYVNEVIVPLASDSQASSGLGAPPIPMLGSPTGGLAGAIALGAGWGIGQALGESAFSSLTGPSATSINAAKGS